MLVQAVPVGTVIDNTAMATFSGGITSNSNTVTVVTVGVPAAGSEVNLDVARLRRFVADPDYMTRLDHMLSQDTADRLAALIDPGRAMPDPKALSEEVHRDTIYLTVVDKDRKILGVLSHRDILRASASVQPASRASTSPQASSPEAKLVA